MASSAASTAWAGSSNTAIRPSPRRLTISPSQSVMGGSAALPTLRSRSSDWVSPASSAQSENSTRSVNRMAFSLCPCPRPWASETDCQTWNALSPSSRMALGRSAATVVRR